MGATREEIEKKVRQLTSNWQVYDLAERARDYPQMNMLNQEHRDICRWLAENGMPFGSLTYNRETLTFSVPATIMSVASM